ncbi:Hydrolase, partial [Sarracenia purpurea var. burkii]
ISFNADGEEIGKIQPESDQTIRKLVGLPESSEHIYVNATNKLAPFDRGFHIVFGISVGGLTDFDDTCDGNPKKPWTNTSPKAMLNFWRAKDQWSKTWIGESSALQIDHVK